jgi:hypothetical protein
MFMRIYGFKSEGLSYSYLNGKFVGRILNFCRENIDELHREQEAIESLGGMRYPLMKLIDMYFWQIGFERSNRMLATTSQMPGRAVAKEKTIGT